MASYGIQIGFEIAVSEKSLLMYQQFDKRIGGKLLGKLIGIAYKDVVSSSDGQALSFEFVYTALKSYAALAQEVEKEAEQETAGVSEGTGATDDAAEPAEPEPAPVPEDIQLLREIRDLLQAGK